MSRQQPVPKDPTLYSSAGEADDELTASHQQLIQDLVGSNSVEFNVTPLKLPEDYEQCAQVFRDGVKTPVDRLFQDLQRHDRQAYLPVCNRMYKNQRAFGDVSLVHMRPMSRDATSLDRPIAILLSNSKLSFLYACLLHKYVNAQKANAYVRDTNQYRLPIIVVLKTRRIAFLNINELETFLFSHRQDSRYYRAISQFKKSSINPNFYTDIKEVPNALFDDATKRKVDALVSDRSSSELQPLKLPTERIHAINVFTKGRHTAHNDLFKREFSTMSDFCQQILSDKTVSGKVAVAHVRQHGTREIKFPVAIVLSCNRMSFLYAYLLYQTLAPLSNNSLPMIVIDSADHFNDACRKHYRFINPKELAVFLRAQADPMFMQVIRDFNIKGTVDTKPSDCTASDRLSLLGQPAKKAKKTTGDSLASLAPSATLTP